MGKIKKILSTFVILISIFTISTMKVEAATGTISITSNKSQVVVGNSVTFTVTVKSSVNMAALQYNISYDSSMLSLTSGNSSDAPVFGNNVKSKTYTFKFKAKKSGTATFKFNAVGAAMDKDEEITFSSKSKNVKIITQAQLEASYSKNNNLSSLGVEGYTLSPSFSSSITSYTVNLPANTESINITGKKADSEASVEGLGTKNVVDGTNTIKVTVTAENGSTKTYTINAIVEELNPIYVTINEIEYTVIRKTKLLTTPNSDFIATTTTINEEEVPAFYNEKANITLVGLKNQEGNIELYIYDSTTNTYIKYNQYTFPELILYIKDKEIENYTQKTELTIDEKTINAYTIENDSYYYFYAINLSTGEESIYRYDNKENTIQRYIQKEVIVDETEEEKPLVDEKIYQYIIIGLLGFIFLTYIIILLNLIFKGNKKKKKKETAIEPTNNNQTEKEELSKKEIKDIENENNKENEKEKLLKETEEELTRINNSSPTDTTEIEQTIKEVLEEKNTKKGNKNKKKKKTKKEKDI